MRATDRRTAIVTYVGRVALNNTAPIIEIGLVNSLQVFREITNATNNRTLLAAQVPIGAVGHTAVVAEFERGRAIASTLVLANMNSIPLDWAARSSIAGTHMNIYIIKQLPILPPDIYLEEVWTDLKFVELVYPRVLELTYTANDMRGLARDLGYEGDPFTWDDRRRHCLRSELDAIFAHMYQLNRTDLEWILDAPTPSSAFPTLKQHEEKIFGEYLTKRFVLTAFDQLARGVIPNLEHESE